MKFIGLNFAKYSIIVLIIILGISIMLDWFHMYRNGRDINCLDNYISFEKRNINEKRLSFIKQIQTSLEFMGEERFKRDKNMLNLESKDAADYEDAILSWYPETKEFDSLSFSDRILIKHADVLHYKDQKIRSFYELRYELELLEVLYAISGSTTGIADYFGYNIVRSVVEDSVFIGNYAMSDNRKKFAFILNDLYFPSSLDGIYTIPWSDTLNVETIIMESRKTYIDTTRHKQVLIKTATGWRSTPGSLAAE